MTNNTPFTPLEKTEIILLKDSLLNQLYVRIDQAKLQLWHKSFFLSGGAIASLLQGENPKDYDLYCKEDNLVKSILDYFKNGAGKELVADVSEKYMEFIGQDGKMITANAITLKNGLQFILKMHGDPESVRSNFDFVHCKPYLDLDSKKLYISKEQYDACKQKKLIINNPKTVTSHRRFKFIERGYKE